MLDFVVFNKDLFSIGCHATCWFTGALNECHSSCPSWGQSRFIMVIKKQWDDEGYVLGERLSVFLNR